MDERTLRAILRYELDRNSYRKAIALIEELREALEDVDKSSNRAGQRGGRAMSIFSLESLGALAGVGALAGGVYGLINSLHQLASQASQVFQDIVKEGVSLNIEMEKAAAVFATLFGDTEQANVFIEIMKDYTTQLGIATSEGLQFGKTLVPDTTDLEQFMQLLEVAVTGSRDVGRSLDDVRRGIEEFIGGNTRSLQNVLNLQTAEVTQIKELAKEYGTIDALIQVLSARYEKYGIQVDTFTNTFGMMMDRIMSKGQDLQITMTQPIFEELRIQAEALEAVIVDREDDFAKLASMVGYILAQAVEVGGQALTQFLAAVKTEQVAAFLAYLFRVFEGVRLLTEVVYVATSSWYELVGSMDNVVTIIKVISPAMGYLIEGVTHLDELLITTTKLFALSTSSMQGWGLVAFDIYRKLQAGEEIDRESFLDSFNKGADVTREQLTKINQKFLESEARLKEQEEVWKKLLEGTQAATVAMDTWAKGAGDAFDAQALAEYEEALEKVTKAYKDLNEQVTQRREDLELRLARQEADLQEETANQLLELDEQLAEERLDIEQSYVDDMNSIEQSLADKRIDLAKQTAQEIEDTYRKYQQSLQDSDISYARDLLKLERDTATKRLNIEEDYRERLSEIQRTWDMDSEEAARANNASAFLSARRRRDQQVEEAQIGREQQIRDLQQQAQIEREELRLQHEEQLADKKLQLERELEEQRIADERKRVEAEASAQKERDERRAALDQAIQELVEKKDAEIAEIAEKEEEKREKMAKAHGRALEDLDTYYSRRYQKIQENLAAEIALVESFTVSVEDAASRSERAAQRATAAWREARSQAHSERSALRAGGGRPTGRPNDPTFLTPGMQAGGYATKDSVYRLAEQGRREFVLSHDTTTAMERALSGPLTQQKIVTGLQAGRQQTMLYSPTYYISERDDAQSIMSMIDAHLNQKLVELERS